tara:strand:+ start:428 stop:763 length:336 start_codon:yes stop_codon:yes gene_type:complete
MLSIFDQLYNFIFPKSKVDFKLGDVIYLFAKKGASQKTRTIVKIYGKQGFIVCDSNFYPVNRKRRAIKVISRQYRKKYSRQDRKIKKQVWVGWIPVEEVSWIRKQKPNYME